MSTLLHSVTVGSHAFAFPRTSDGVWTHYLLPLLGSINHAGPEAANARVRWDHAAGAFQAIALRDITQGEEVGCSGCAQQFLKTLDAGCDQR